MAKSKEDQMIQSWSQNSCSEALISSPEILLGFSTLEDIVYEQTGIDSRFAMLAAQSYILADSPKRAFEYAQYWADWATLASFLCVMSEEDLQMYLSLY